MEALKGEELNRLAVKLGNDWKVVKEHQLEKTFPFRDFKTALDFTVKVGAIAEHEGHHPDITLSWGKVGITILTHDVNGLTESDFVLAAKIEKISA